MYVNYGYALGIYESRSSFYKAYGVFVYGGKANCYASRRTLDFTYYSRADKLEADVLYYVLYARSIKRA